MAPRGHRSETTLAPATTFDDPALTERMVANLIDGAARYNHPGGRVALRSVVSDGRALIRVANTGPQIPAAEVDQLFEPFRRVAGDPTDHDRHGLGLFDRRGIASAHDATLDAQAEPDGARGNGRLAVGRGAALIPFARGFFLE